MTEVTYTLHYRLVGPPYGKDGDAKRRRLLTILGEGGYDVPVRTDEEALMAMQAFIERPWTTGTEVEVIRLTKVTTTTEYEDVEIP